MAIQVLGIVLWALLAGFGAWLLVTGRPLPFELPAGAASARRLRVVGLVYCVLSVYLASRLIQGAYPADGLIASYVGFVGSMVWVAWDRRRKARNRQV